MFENSSNNKADKMILKTAKIKKNTRSKKNNKKKFSNSKILKMIYHCLFFKKLTDVISWKDEKKGQFKIKFMNKNNPKWHASMLSLFKMSESVVKRSLKYKAKEKEKHDESTKCRFRSNLNKLVSRKSLELIDKEVVDNSKYRSYQFVNYGDELRNHLLKKEPNETGRKKTKKGDKYGVSMQISKPESGDQIFKFVEDVSYNTYTSILSIRSPQSSITGSAGFIKSSQSSGPGSAGFMSPQSSGPGSAGFIMSPQISVTGIASPQSSRPGSAGFMSPQSSGPGSAGFIMSPQSSGPGSTGFIMSSQSSVMGSAGFMLPQSSWPGSAGFMSPQSSGPGSAGFIMLPQISVTGIASPQSSGPGSAGFIMSSQSSVTGSAGFIASSQSSRPGSAGFMSPQSSGPGSAGFMSPQSSSPGSAGSMSPQSSEIGSTCFIEPLWITKLRSVDLIASPQSRELGSTGSTASPWSSRSGSPYSIPSPQSSGLEGDSFMLSRQVGELGSESSIGSPQSSELGSTGSAASPQSDEFENGWDFLSNCYESSNGLSLGSYSSTVASFESLSMDILMDEEHGNTENEDSNAIVGDSNCMLSSGVDLNMFVRTVSVSNNAVMQPSPFCYDMNSSNLLLKDLDELMDTSLFNSTSEGLTKLENMDPSWQMPFLGSNERNFNFEVSNDLGLLEEKDLETLEDLCLFMNN